MTSTFVSRGKRHLRFAWQAWHLATLTCIVRGRRVTCGTGLALTSQYFAWQARHLVTSIFVSRGRRGTWCHPPSFRVAGVALGDIDLHCAWQVWPLWHWAGSGDILIILSFCLAAFVSRGRRGTWCHPPSFRRGRRGTWRH